MPKQDSGDTHNRPRVKGDFAPELPAMAELSRTAAAAGEKSALHRIEFRPLVVIRRPIAGCSQHQP